MSEELVARARKGEAQAWAEIYEQYYERIFRYLFSKVSDREEAEDLSAEVFVKAMGAIGSFRWQGAPFSAWLFRIAANLVTDRYRRAASRHRYLERYPPSASSHSAAEEAEASLERQEVMRAVGQLTPAQQEVLRLRFAADLSTAEVAQALKKSQAAVKALQHSALVALRKRLSEHG